MFNLNDYLNSFKAKGASESRKRGFLQLYSSEYIQPSKYLLISEEENKTEETTQPSNDDKQQVDDVQEEEEFKDHRSAIKIIPERIHSSDHDNLHQNNNLIVEDCWRVIFEFCQAPEMKSMILVCKNWFHLFLPQLKSFIETCRVMYDENVHLEELKQHVENNGDSGTIADGLFTELATWKAYLCYDDLDEKEYSGLSWDRINDNQVEIEIEGLNYRQKVLPFGVPLCKGTISDQYELVSSEIDTKTYRKMIEQFMGIPHSEQGTICFNPFELSDKMEQEKDMVNVYLHEIQESLDTDTDGPIALDGNVIYTDDTSYTSAQDSSDFTFYALRSGIKRLARRGGIKYFEPSVIEDMLYELKKVIHLTLKDAYEKKFPNKTEELKFEESRYQYDTYRIDPYDAYCPTFDDNIDTDLKLNHEEILESFEKVTGLKVTYATVEDPYELNDSGMKEYYAKEHGTQSVHELEVNSKDSPLKGDGNELEGPTTAGDTPSEDEESEEDLEISDGEDSETEEEDEPSQKTITEQNFIDDSEIYTFDLDNLGDSLQDELMKVSIRVHEQVYGKERAHSEKLYLKHWYGCGDLFFQNCSKDLDNPPSMQFIPQQKTDEAIIEGEANVEETPNDVESTFQYPQRYQVIYDDEVSVEEEFQTNEKETLESVCKEDLEYFGYTLYDDNFDEFPIFNGEDDSDENLEQSSEEESLQYQLRRMLREQSYQCIVNYFASHQ
ncbi:hypothetical protein NAEGRDRAFT_82197 [Naegleria gruberi]|uniref:Uncharacterized protein n=1 Tax=Naegleria gruberi TaxID=5762 RepID=D2W317_NAEGR|nr:uncharacterized protein NAEGRDRAFT_82197 [Naegleria gruberi]EFC36535.1 hypothetical protein NAEGRDRAFT_82197 [Naegleria gruberi]|eukprot:XP_002669279.1 hypothetical protein NAEGRDRAFT_82197 [Naegleria gruberi strain NEG-M]